MFSRRALLAALAASPALAALPALAQDAQDASPADLAVPGPIKDMTLGKADAPVKVYEYASMTCPHCARFEKDVFPTIKDKYIDTGKVLWTLREFPLDPRATAGFMLARCAGDDKYYAMIDVLFAQQANWAFVDAAQVLPGLTQIAKQAGFTQERFDTCLKDQTLYDGVMAVKKRAEDVFKIDGTPTFFINGKRYSGELSVDEFDKAVAAFLKS
ncbi:DsbA family protein [Labrys wisconsinensis]|uniref:Protein-disulfide isomerase n=1 Tax=Labrys wisconsinensis TaxID=425677 RepID=A0ABU0JAN8_9HYPH|nr:DsbA family protein [Labrys wisconsinensis]MDQ0470503.1 protein-disulfide isomerase [Labrys wisconsinensis]